MAAWLRRRQAGRGRRSIERDGPLGRQRRQAQAGRRARQEAAGRRRLRRRGHGLGHHQGGGLRQRHRHSRGEHGRRQALGPLPRPYQRRRRDQLNRSASARPGTRRTKSNPIPIKQTVRTNTPWWLTAGTALAAAGAKLKLWMTTSVLWPFAGGAPLRSHRFMCTGMGDWEMVVIESVG